MRSFSIPAFAGALCLGAVFVWQAPAPADDAVPPPPPPQNDIVTQARGPVHEAYAEPAETRPEPEPIVAKQPPDPIAELPPDQKPAGDNIEWIPGYWAWDSDTTDFTWISGFWRAPPPTREWSPGHWQEVGGGWQWVAGVWAAQNVQQVEYLPPPPPSIDNGPSVPAVGETSVYVPGCWVYRQTRYLWRPGYWINANPNWCWIPDHYIWTPAGYLFVAGYWDYPLESRGLLFAPVQFTRRIYLQRNFVYVPQYVVQPDFLIGALFVRPAYGSYYFGDYFEPRYQKRGFTSWIDYRVGRFSYDPNFAYYRHRYRNDSRWVASLSELYALRRSGQVPRPPRTLVQQTRIVNNITINKTENVTVNKNIHITNIQNVTALTPLNRVQSVPITGLAGLTGTKPGFVARSGDHATAIIPASKTIKLEPVSQERQIEVKRHVALMRQYAARQQQEQAKILSSGTMPVKPTDRPMTVKIDLPKNPVRPATPRVETKVPVQAPPLPSPPKREERHIPPHQPPKPSAPPTVHVPTPGPKQPPEPIKEPMPPRKIPAPPVKEPPPAKAPPEPPRREPPQVKQPPTPPAHKEPPPPAKQPPTPPGHKEPPPAVKQPPTPPRREPPPTKVSPPPPVKAAPPRKEPPPPTRKEPPPATQPPGKEPPPKGTPMRGAY